MLSKLGRVVVVGRPLRPVGAETGRVADFGGKLFRLELDWGTAALDTRWASGRWLFSAEGAERAGAGRNGVEDMVTVPNTWWFCLFPTILYKTHPHIYTCTNTYLSKIMLKQILVRIGA